MADHEGYSPRNRAERVISAGRLFLAVFLTGAILLDPTEPRPYAPLVQWLAVLYLAYAGGLAALVWKRRATTETLSIVTHAVDLVLFSTFMHFTDSTDSPFFVYFTFATFCGAIRWHGRGALLTGAAVLAVYVVIALTDLSVLRQGEFELARFIARCTQLAVLTGLLAYLGTYQHRLQREITGLAAWPRRLPTREADALDEILTYAADVLAAPRVVLVWEEEDEPSLRLAFRSGEVFEMSREHPDAFGMLVTEDLQRSSFLCSDAALDSARVLQRVPAGFRFWRGAPLDRAFVDRYGVKSVIGLRLSTSNIQGWLFALDKPQTSSDDLLLGDIVGRLVTGALELHALIEQRRGAAAGEERLRLARELHDGVLQSLTAASLQAQRARQVIATDPTEAKRRMAMVEETILSEQQALRLAIEDLKPGAAGKAAFVDISPRLRDVATRVARQWDIRADVTLDPQIPPIPQRTAHEVTRMLQEALVNAIRHGGAREVAVSCGFSGRELTMAVSYQGRGFSGFHGRHDLASLNRMKSGPRTLKERVALVGGSLEIDSRDNGARVEMRIPIYAETLNATGS